MHLLYGDLPAAGDCLLNTEQRHYLRRVLRCADGAAVRVSDGRGVFADGVLAGDAVQVQQRGTQPHPFAAPLTLLLPLLAGAKMRDVLRAASAYGAAQVVVWTPRKGKVRDAGNLARWQGVLEDAGRVAHSCHLPRLTGPVPLAEALATVSGAHLLLLDAGGGAWQPPAADTPLALILGPESGFADDEYAAIRAAGATAVALGPSVLRVEQAALAALAVVRYLTR